MIVGAQLLNAVNSNIDGYAGIIIIAAATFVVTLFGYKVVHLYEFWSWIPSFIVFLIVVGEFAHSGDFNKIPMGAGTAEAGSVLSYAASVYGFGTGWTSLAADYTVYQPRTVSRPKVFAWTFGGLIFPLLFTEILGLAIATATVPPSGDGFVNPYYEGYKYSGIGGLLAAVLFPPLGRFGQFCLVVLALSIIANNCPNMYSVTFSLQVLGRWTQAVPRFIWTFVGTVIYCAIAIPGYSHFESVLEDFMLLIVGFPPFIFVSPISPLPPWGLFAFTLFSWSSSLQPLSTLHSEHLPRPINLFFLQGYWLAIYEGIALTEHFVFAHRKYDVTIYATPSSLPPGIAAIGAFCFGVMGAVLGMAQVWFIGPIGKRIGLPEHGGDVGFPLAFAFSSISYAVLRTMEKHVFGR